MTTLEIQLQTQKDLAKANQWPVVYINHPDELEGHIPNDLWEIGKALIKKQRWITHEITTSNGTKVKTLIIL